MRIRALFFVSLGLAISSPAFAANDARDIIGRQLQELNDAIAVGDAAVWEKYLDPDCFYEEEDDTIKSKADMVKEIVPLPSGITGKIVVEILRFHQNGDIAVVVSRDHETENYFGQILHAEYLVTTTWRREAGQWRMIAGQLLAEPIDPPAIPLPADKLAEYAGTYRLKDSDVTYVVAVDGGKLTGARAGKTPTVLNAEATDVFFVTGQPRIRDIFQRDALGHIIGYDSRREGRDVVWVKVN